MKDQALLQGPSPHGWLDAAVSDLPTLLIDHAECEKKAAGSALSLIYRYPQHYDLCAAASRFAREELRHYEIVARLLRVRDVAHQRLAPSNYAAGLRSCVRSAEPGRLLDTLLVAAFIEARSCERFGMLTTRLDDIGSEPDLTDCYARLLAAEARHAKTYLRLARQVDVHDEIDARIATIAQVEWQLINSPAAALRFHSGVPVNKKPEFK